MNEVDLLERCQQIEGLSIAQLSHHFMLPVPDNPNSRKGWFGRCIEVALNAQSGNKSVPDFIELGIELKTIGINQRGQPSESTFITHVPLLTIHQQLWETSTCYVKLRRILWVPIEDDERIPLVHRRVGRAILWSPSKQDLMILKQDWEEITLLISTGRLSLIDATVGQYLQIRPKAANGNSLCDAFDELGQKIKTMPRGFYLRRLYTEKILQLYFARSSFAVF